VFDNENKPVISFDTDASNSVTSGDENTVATPSITVKQDRRSIYASTINYSADAATGTTTLTADDYTLADGTATIDALSTTTTVPLEVTSDTKYEADEKITIALDNTTVSAQTTASGSNMNHDYTITNDDPKPTLEFTTSSGTAAASNPEEADATETITVSLSAITGVASSVTYSIGGTATAGTDFTDGTTDYDSNPATNVITWDADDATIGKTIVINFTDDVIDEGDETIVITLSGVSGLVSLIKHNIGEINYNCFPYGRIISIPGNDICSWVTIIVCCAISKICASGGGTTYAIGYAAGDSCNRRKRNSYCLGCVGLLRV
jgi:hypothetical protein